MYFSFTVGDFKAVTTASQVGGGSTAVFNQCINISHIASEKSECIFLKQISSV